MSAVSVNNQPSVVNKSVQYECESCEINFCLLDHMVVCPSCGSQDLRQMVIIYKESDPDLDQMYNDKDWSAGD